MRINKILTNKLRENNYCTWAEYNTATKNFPYFIISSVANLTV